MEAREPRDPRKERQAGEARDLRDLRQPGDPRDPRDLRQPGDPRDLGNGNGKVECRVHRILGIVFFMIGVVVSIDLLHLTTQYQSQHQDLVAHTKCNQGQNDALVTIEKARRDVDNAALFYDETLQVFLATPVQYREPNDPASQNMARAVNLLVEARKRAVTAYEQNPIPNCVASGL